MLGSKAYLTHLNNIEFRIFSAHCADNSLDRMSQYNEKIYKEAAKHQSKFPRINRYIKLHSVQRDLI